MSYPFPGMNPWLEDSRIWRNVHVSLINSIRDILAPQLAPRYFVDVETHTYIARTPDAPPVTRYPDVAILEVSGGAIAVAPSAVTAVPLEIQLPFRETVEEPYLAIRLVPEGEVVTVIELLSHTNKRAGSDRESYLQERELFLDSDVHFVEIDLLRAYNPMPYTERIRRGRYRIFIHRRRERDRAFVYGFGVRDAIPVFPLPLLPDDPEPSIDLGALLQNLFDRARYDLIINYTEPPSPELNAEDAAWFQQRLAQVNGARRG